MIKLVFICVSLVCASLYFSRAGSTPQNQVRQWSISFIYQKIFFFHYTTYLRRIGSRENILKTIVTVSGKDDKECVNQFISVPQWDQCGDRVPRVLSGPSDNRSKLIKKDTFPFAQFNRDLWIVRTVRSNFAAQIWYLIQIFKMKLLFQRICAPSHSPIDINVHGRRGKKVRDCEFLYMHSSKF